jgi:hypothetical protein
MKKTLTLFSFLAAASADAQQGVMVYRLGRDTVAVEQFNRTAQRFAGEMVSRGPASVVRFQYEIVLGADGRPVSAVMRRRQADGTPLANNPSETRLTFAADSVRREIVWPDSTQRRSFGAAKAWVAFPVYAYAPLELLALAKQKGIAIDSMPAFAIAGNPAFTGLAMVGGDTLRLRGSPYPMMVRFDRDGRLLSVDGSMTTQKIVGTRVAGPVDFAGITARMRPTGVLSARGTATLTFGQSPIFIDYGRPQVRERTVWGGTLVPFDSVWRAGANAATHLATTLPLTFGTTAVSPGLYTLWIQHTRAGTFLILNKGVGQWGTSYDPAQDLGRVQMQLAAGPEFVEEYTITIRVLPQNRGAIDFAWGPSVATATFDIRR